MTLHDHPYSDVNIIYSVVQTWERTTDRGTNSAPNIKRLCNGEYRPGQLYILSSRVAPDTTDADVHALCTKPAVLKMKESGKSSRNHRTVRGTTETCRHQVNERSVWLPQRSMKVNWQPHVFQGLGGSVSWVVGLSNNSYKPITNTVWVRARRCKLQKGCTRLAVACNKVYQLLAHGRWVLSGYSGFFHH
jgi:hypothetical protein